MQVLARSCMLMWGGMPSGAQHDQIVTDGLLCHWHEHQDPLAKQHAIADTCDRAGPLLDIEHDMVWEPGTRGCI